jgi:hypothetical protein
MQQQAQALETLLVIPIPEANKDVPYYTVRVCLRAPAPSWPCRRSN